jgi:tetratricopeptide (TPR) repeat protein
MTSDISWIREVLTSSYPGIVKDKGVDLNNNGKIEGEEIFGDLNRNGAIDDKDFWMFLERNKSIIANQIEFIGWQGKEIHDDNIINHDLLVESQLFSKEDVQKTYEKINAIIARMKEKLSGTSSPEDLLKSAYQILLKDFSIVIVEQHANKSLIDNLLKGELDCDTLTIIFLAIGHEFKWPLYAVPAPEHFFIRWNDGKYTFNFDQGDIDPDAYYEKWLNIDKNAVKQGVYLKSLSRKETLGLFYRNRGLTKKLILGNHKGAIEDFDEAIKLGPGQAGHYSNRGDDKYDLGDYKGAIEDQTEEIKIDPNEALAYNNRGNAKGRLGDNKGAIEDFTAAIGIDPKFAAAYYNRGLTRQLLGDYKGAIEDFTAAIKFNYKNSGVYYHRGDAKCELRDYRGAIEDYTEVIRRAPNFADTYKRRGSAKERLWDLKGAIDDYTEASRIELEAWKDSEYSKK